MRCRVLRAFLLRGQRQEPGSVVELSEGDARELTFRRVVQPAEALPERQTMTTEEAPAVTGRRRRRASKDS